MAETWRPVPGYEGHYEVSDQGRVRSTARRLRFVSKSGREAFRLTRPRILAQQVTNAGYALVQLHLDNGRRACAVHSLVAAAFIGPRPGGLDVCHGNGDRLDNRAANLRYDTRAANHADKEAHGTAAKGEAIAQHKLTTSEVLMIRQMRSASAECLAALFGVSASQIERVQRRENWCHV